MGFVKVETVAGNCKHILLDDGLGNTFTTERMNELIECMNSVSKDSAVSSVLLTSGRPKVYSMGIDPDAVLNTDLSGRRKVFETLMNLCRSFLASGKPIITDINGAAMAGGAVLSQLATFRSICNEHGKISFSEAKVGLPLPEFIQQLIISRTGPKNFMHIGLLAKTYKGEAAVAEGLAEWTYRNDVEREQVLTDIVGRFTRLPAEVTAKNLLTRYEPLLGFMEKGIDGGSGSFDTFLGEAFLETGLKAVKAGETPVFGPS